MSYRAQNKVALLLDPHPFLFLAVGQVFDALPAFGTPKKCVCMRLDIISLSCIFGVQRRSTVGVARSYKIANRNLWGIWGGGAAKVRAGRGW